MAGEQGAWIARVEMYLIYLSITIKPANRSLI